MTTTDGKGIIFYEETDPVSPLHTLLNTGQQSISDALGKLVIQGTATLVAPASNLKVLSGVSFGVTFKSAPTVFITSPITSTGVVIFTHPVSIGATTFDIRYITNGSGLSDTPVAWAAFGSVA